MIAIGILIISLVALDLLFAIMLILLLYYGREPWLRNQYLKMAWIYTIICILFATISACVSVSLKSMFWFGLIVIPVFGWFAKSNFVKAAKLKEKPR